MSLIRVVIDPVLKLRPSGYGRIFCGFRIKIKDDNGIRVFVTSNNKIKIKSEEVRRDGKSLCFSFLRVFMDVSKSIYRRLLLFRTTVPHCC